MGGEEGRPGKGIAVGRGHRLPTHRLVGVAWLALLTPCLATGRGLVTAKLVADVATVQPGRPFRLGVLFEMREGWHIYWKNPGNAGLATELALRAPKGFAVGELRWPVPVTFRQPGDIVGYGYEGEVLVWAEVTPPAAAAPGSRVVAEAAPSWLACRDRCVQGNAALRLALPVRATAAPANARLFAAWAKRLPVAAADSALAATAVRRAAGQGAYVLALTWAQRPAGIEWLPAPPENLDVDAVSLRTTGSETLVAFRVRVLGGKAPSKLDSLIVYQGAGGERRGVWVPVPLGGKGP